MHRDGAKKQKQEENQCAVLEVVGLWKNFFLLFGCMFKLVVQ